MLSSSTRFVAVLVIHVLLGAVSVHGHDHHHHHHHRNLQDSEASSSSVELSQRACGTPEPTEEEILAAIQVELEYFEALEKEQQQANSNNNQDFIPTPSPSPTVVAAATTTTTAAAPTPGHNNIRGLFTSPGPGSNNGSPTVPTPRESTLPCPAGTPFSYTVPVVYHVISPTTGPASPAVTNTDLLQQQHTHMNNAFCGSGFHFDWIDTTQNTNENWYKDNDEQGMKAALRQGGRETLNIYFNDPGDGLLGYAYFPTVENIVLDGVTVNDGTLPGGKFSNFNEGDTLVHEVGHWLGLFHTVSLVLCVFAYTV